MRSETHRRLVQEEQPRTSHQSTADREHLLLAPGERAARLLEPLLQDGKEAEHAIEIFGQDRCAHSPTVSAHLEVVSHRHPREYVPPFRRLAHASRDDLMRFQPIDPLVFERDRSPHRTQHAGDRLERRGLPRAVPPDQRHDLSSVDVQGDISDGLDRAVTDFEIV